MPTIIDLGQKVKAKYPGVYDSLSDQEVGAKVKAKYPQYSSFEDVQTEPTTPVPPGGVSGFVQGVAKDVTQTFAKLPVTAYRSAQHLASGATALGQYLGGNTTGATQTIREANQRDATPVHVNSFIGDVKPVTTKLGAVGLGAELASYLVAPPETKAVVEAGAKGLLGQALKTGLKEGAILGGTGAFGKSLQDENPTVLNTILQTALGTASGGVLGGTLGAGSTAVGLGLSKTARSNYIEQAVKDMTDRYSEVFSGTKPAGKQLQKSLDRGKNPAEFLVKNGYRLEQSGGKITAQPTIQSVENGVKPLNQIMNTLIEEENPRVAARSADDVEGEILKRIADDPSLKKKGLVGSMQEKARSIIEEYKKIYGDNWSLKTINNIKQGQWDLAKSFDTAVPQLSRDVNYVIGNQMKRYVEDSVPNVSIKELNNLIGDHYDAILNLNKINGNAVKGGRLNPYVMRVIGSVVGGHSGPFGSIAGAVTGDYLAHLAQDVYISNPVKLKILEQLKVENPEIVQTAEKYIKALQDLKSQQKLLPAGGEATKLPSSIPVRPIKPGSEYIGPNIMEAGQGYVPPQKVTPPTNLMDKLALPGLKSEGAIPKTTLGETIKSKGVQKPTIQLKRDVTVTTLTGEKVTIPADEVLNAYESGGKALLKDGREYVVSKSQYENIKNNSKIEGQVKEFAPELKGTEETIRGETKGESFNKFMENNVGKNWEDLGEHEKGLWRQEYESLDINSLPAPKYSQYQLPDGENYREVLIKAPRAPVGKTKVYQVVDENGVVRAQNQNLEEAKKYMKPGRTIKELETSLAKDYSLQQSDFKSSHWEEPNVISHLRLNERTYQGKKVTFMEELQSDWAREGRSKGFATEITKDAARQQGFTVYKAKSSTGGESYFIDNKTDEYFYRKGFTNTGFDTEAQAWDSIIKKLKETSSAVPNNPLLKNWQEMTVKRALKEAVDSGSDYFSWINGDQTSARYNLATHIDNVRWSSRGATWWPEDAVRSIELSPKTGGDINMQIDKDGQIVHASKGDWNGKKLDEVLGKGLADKIMEKDSGKLSGEGLKFGGEWANNLYDKQVKDIVQKVTGGKVESMDMGLPIGAKDKTWMVKSDRANYKLTPEKIKVGLEIGDGNNAYIITDVLGDGKFKAVPKRIWSEMKHPETHVFPNDTETFDISTKKTTQQGIKLTPEIKAKIRGEAPRFKKIGGPSGVLKR